MIKKLQNSETCLFPRVLQESMKDKRVPLRPVLVNCLYFTSGIFTVYHKKALDNYFTVCLDTYTVGKFNVVYNMIV